MRRRAEEETQSDGEEARDCFLRFVAFDILYYKGAEDAYSLLRMPLFERK